MLNWIFFLLIGSSVVVAAFSGTMQQVTEASLASAKGAVDLAISLVGQMALWLGLMAILKEAGLMRSLARGLKPVMKRLFPDVPEDHPAMGAMIMNFSANILGITNASTPFGLKAMVELNKLNAHPGVATNAMVLFLAINTAGIAVLPLGAVAMRAAMGSKDATGIIAPSLIVTACATLVAITMAKLFQRLPVFRAERFAVTTTAESEVKEPAADTLDAAEKEIIEGRPATGWRRLMPVVVLGAIVWAIIRYVRTRKDEETAFNILNTMLSHWLLPLIMLSIVVLGMTRRVQVYDVFIAAAKEGFEISVRIIPFVVAILVSIGMFRASGGMDFLVRNLAPFTEAVGLPAEALPMALIRPLSGQGALAIMLEVMKTHGPDSFIGYLVCVISGSMETTFYVLAVYYGSVNVRATRHTVPTCLVTDAAALTASIITANIFWRALT